MNLMAGHMDTRMKWCQFYKNQNWDLVIFSDETVFSNLEKIKRSWSRKAQFIEFH